MLIGDSKHMLKKLLMLSVMGLVLSMHAIALANSLTIVASKAQIKNMDALFTDLKGNDVSIKIVDPADIKKALDDDYLLILTSPDNPNYATVSKQFAPPVRAQINAKDGKRLIILRDAWKPEQEVIVFAANKEADIDNIRKEHKNSWWDIMSGWYDIGTSEMGGY